MGLFKSLKAAKAMATAALPPQPPGGTAAGGRSQHGLGEAMAGFAATMMQMGAPMLMATAPERGRPLPGGPSPVPSGPRTKRRARLGSPPSRPGTLRSIPMG